MKKILVFLISSALIISNFMSFTYAQKDSNNKVYESNVALNEEKMYDLFSKVYSKIISYNNSTALKSSGTHSVTTCIEMKKRSYGHVGYSKQCFQETCTGIFMSSGTYSLSLSFAGVGFSIPVDNFLDRGNGKLYALDNKEKNLVKNHNYFSCLKIKGYVTWAKYRSKIYDNASGKLLKTKTYTHSYIYKNNKTKGADYDLVVRSNKACKAIRKSGYVGTKKEKASMKPWKKVKNPTKASILPWK